MATKVNWETEWDKALSRAKSEGKTVLLDFYNPGWIGCQQMDAVTYPDEKVAEFVQTNLIPLRVPFDHKPLAADFNVKWTPTLITLDTDGKEHHRTVGFLAPEELIPSLLLGMGKTHFESERFGEAIAVFERILKDHSKSNSAPEAIYLHGVARYKSTHQPMPLREAYDRLSAEYPSSEWTNRAYPYRLIN